MSLEERPSARKRKDPNMASKNVLEITTENFDAEVVKSGQPVLVDFWAPWCGPCRTLGPIIDKLADKYSGQVKVGKCNVDENADLAMKYDITTIPRVLIFKGGDKPLHQLVGLRQEQEFSGLLDKAIVA